VTIREKLARRVVRFWIVFVLGMLLFFGAVFFQGVFGFRRGIVIGILGVVVLGVLLAIGQFLWFRCPSCRGNLSQLLLGRGPFRFGPRVHYCPYCGLSLDERIPTDEGVPDGETW